jgi:hypothetical protein
MAVTLDTLMTVGLVLIVAGVVLAFGLQITGELREDIGTDDCAGYFNTTSGVCQVNTTNATQLSANSYAYNATVDTISGVSKVTDKFPTIGLVVAAVIIIGLLISGFSFAKR